MALVALVVVVFAPSQKIFTVFTAHAAGVPFDRYESIRRVAIQECERGKAVTGSNVDCTKAGDAAATTAAKEAGSAPIGNTLAEWISNIVYVFTVGLGGLIAYVASYFFNFAVYLSLSSTAYAMNFVTSGWEMTRDLANMAFIFILIYIAVNIMLLAETSDTMKTLVRVIAIALVINFSFFFVRVVIDGGNILAIQFYNGIGGPNAPLLKDSLQNRGPIVNTAGNAVASLTRASTEAQDLTVGIMGALYPASWYCG
ncbi:MAG: Uncharacterized protein G01um101456_629 [Parcubacteria group bacterium Gr01-1014_56]|nr:MAG: Uncharacterized protein G01um101456_629 [Parcubacteria group bacterium Gr01-1014_56]